MTSRTPIMIVSDEESRTEQLKTFIEGSSSAERISLDRATFAMYFMRFYSYSHQIFILDFTGKENLLGILKEIQTGHPTAKAIVIGSPEQFNQIEDKQTITKYFIQSDSFGIECNVAIASLIKDLVKGE